MAGYEAVLGEIDEASKAAGRLIDDARGLDAAGVVPEGDAGLSGTRSAGRLAALKSAWSSKGQHWAGAWETYSGDLGKAVANYRTNEAAAQQDLHVTASHGGPGAS
ncbi:hypothetical protein [Amycolatopsis speibonae]|uniref:WXG100 family type VII secretion target n=1 Tax=Amycolatopsis speibonae TaxID=1450224 RepID=A0ABV7P4V0_9PSEU